jgi:hypothetical protein
MVEGTIRSLRPGQHRTEVTLQGVVHTDSGTTISLYMRGEDVLGTVEDGDRVRFDTSSSERHQGVLRVTHLENLTTGSTVSVWDPPASYRLRKMAGPVFLAVIGPVVGVGLVTLLGSSSAGPTGDSGGTILFAGVALIVVALALVAAFATFRLLYVIPRRDRRSALTEAAEPGATKVVPGSARSWSAVHSGAVLSLAVILSIGAAYLAALTIPGS